MVNNRTTGNKQEPSKKGYANHSQHFTFIIFIFVSAIFWLLIKLSQEYSETYDMHIIYKDVPNDKLLTKEIDSTVKFNITSRGFYLAELSLLHPEELIIHLKNYTIHKSEGDKYYISTLPLKESIAKMLDIDPGLISFSKNALSFKLEKLYSKKVPVINNTKIAFKGSYNLYKPVDIVPSKVLIYGTKSGLDSIKFVNTKAIQLSDISENKTIEVELQNPNPGFFKLSPEKVKIALRIAKFTQSKVVVPITSRGSRYQIETFPKMDTVYFNVALTDFDKVNPNDFIVSPVIKGVDLKKVNKLLLKVTRHPDFIKNIRTEPSDVEFILIK